MSRIWCQSVVILLLAGCSGAPVTTERPPGPSLSTEEESQLTGEVLFEGMCDASGAVALSATRLIAADDEDNVLRVYDADRGGAPLSSVDISEAVGVPLKGKRNPRYPEVDLEAATRLADHAYWLSSHGRNKKGKLKDERLKFFATTIAEHGDDIEVLGTYDYLLDDLLSDARYDAFELDVAAELPPKAPGGLNIEGMTAAVEGGVLIGFRNPVPDGLALVVPLVNPEAIVDDPEGTGARFGDPIRLALGGQGIRSLSWWRGRYLIIAGDYGEGGVSSVYTWDGQSQPERVDVDLAGYNPEGFFSPEDRDEILLLSDDGSVVIDDVPCKELEDHERRAFRGRWLRL